MLSLPAFDFVRFSEAENPPVNFQTKTWLSRFG